MDRSKKRIGILGIGGVGGFIGAPLATHFADHPEVEIIFICRGETLQNIKKGGLIFKSADRGMVIRPAMVSDNAQEIGNLDALFLTTKSYALADALKTYETVITPETVIVPLQNMVHAGEIIRSIVPEKGKVLEGCIYVISNIAAPGHVEHKGGPGKVFVGGDKPDAYQWLVKAMAEAGVDITFCEDIKEVLWRKYLFLSPVAAITTAYHKTFGELRDDPGLLEILKDMMLEVKALAAAMGVSIADEVVASSLALLHNFPYAAKSSMQLDFEQDARNEKPFLIDYILEKGAAFGTPTKTYQKMNDKIVAAYPQLC